VPSGRTSDNTELSALVGVAEAVISAVPLTAANNVTDSPKAPTRRILAEPVRRAPRDFTAAATS
jgi:hypothetical protein